VAKRVSRAGIEDVDGGVADRDESVAFEAFEDLVE
jgi:hypothetical protein